MQLLAGGDKAAVPRRRLEGAQAVERGQPAHFASLSFPWPRAEINAFARALSNAHRASVNIASGQAMISLPFASALAAAILSTSFLSGILGMAGGMILMGILLLMMPLAAAMVLHGLTQMAANGWRAWLWRQHIVWPIAAQYAAGAVVAAMAFAVIQVTPSKAAALIILGL